MRALVYHGPGQKSWDEVPAPELVDDTDAIVRVDAVTICGTDLHILKGDVPAVTDGRILGHEAVGTVQSVGEGFVRMKTGGFFAKEFYIPRSAVIELETHRIEVSAARSEFGDAGWSNPPLEVGAGQARDDRTH